LKICWDNLEGLKLTVHGNLRKNNVTYYEKICDYCGEIFLAKSKVIKYCNYKCSAKGPEHRNPITEVINIKRHKARICREYNYYNDPQKCVICDGILTYEQALIRNCKCCSHKCSQFLKFKDPKYVDNFHNKARKWFAKRVNYDWNKWNDYSKGTRLLTYKNYRRFKEVINPDNLLIGKGKGYYNIDHKLSVLDGYSKNIKPEIIAHPCNLQILTEIDNLRKSYKSSISIDKLLHLIDKF